MNEKQKRLNQAYEYLKVIGKVRIQEDVAIAIGSNKGNVSGALKGRVKILTDSFLRRFAQAYSDVINLQWLLTGEGEMCVSKIQKPFETEKDGAASLIELSARLIQEVEELRNQLTEELNDVRQLRSELQSLIMTNHQSNYKYLDRHNPLVAEYKPNNNNPSNELT